MLEYKDVIMILMFIVLIGFLGLCLGSFVNALVWRIYMQDRLLQKAESKSAKKSQKKSTNIRNQKYSILNGRSMCTYCKHELSWYDLIPVVSWLSVGGKCRYCKKQISWQYPVVEVTTSLLFVMSYIFWPLGLNSWLDILSFGVWLILLTGFMALIVYDIRWMLLPNRLVYPMAVLALVLAIVNIIFQPGGIDFVLAVNTLTSLFIASGIFYIIFWLSNGRWIGGGDIKVGIVIGLLLQDPAESFLVLFLASIIGTVVVVPGLLTGKLTRSSKIPFGPFLIVATILVYIFGRSIINWYVGNILLLK